MTRMIKPRRAVQASIAVLMVGSALSGCGSDTAGVGSSTPEVIFENAWIRTTDGAEDTSMTALFGSLVNPGSEAVTLQSADCSPTAAITQVHEMATVEGKMVMREVPAPVEIPAEGHLHLTPGSYHVMLMKLTKELPVGSETNCTVKLSNGQELAVKAQAKKFVEEEEHYHSTEPSASSNG